MAARQAVWVAVFVGVEEGVDRGRAGAGRLWRRVRSSTAASSTTGAEKEEEVFVEGSRDLLSTTLAGLGTAGAFSAWNRFPLATAARTAKLGAKVGCAFGVVQDVLSVVRGRRLGYVEFVKRTVLGRGGGDGGRQVGAGVGG
ncbi:hypothetical protein LTR08_007050 [Meristemomyces frigidus]|nr:hypothetical protein LTR08_007050 [Meristemomyces frigidus]